MTEPNDEYAELTGGHKSVTLTCRKPTESELQLHQQKLKMQQMIAGRPLGIEPVNYGYFLRPRKPE